MGKDSPASMTEPCLPSAPPVAFSCGECAGDASMTIANPFISFRLIPTPGRKTSTWQVVSKSHGDLLGTISWYAGWRQYVFEAEPGCVFSDGCLASVVAFLAEQKMARKRVGAQAALPLGAL